MEAPGSLGRRSRLERDKAAASHQRCLPRSAGADGAQTRRIGLRSGASGVVYPRGDAGGRVGVEPPRPSPTPIDVDGGLISLAATGRGGTASAYRQAGQ
jgi:hypothetical protein